MFHQIYELMVLGMHPAIPYPRRSHFAPVEVTARIGPLRPAHIIQYTGPETIP